MEVTNPFAIIKTQMFFAGLDRSVYEKIFSPKHETAPMSRKEAMLIIERYNMHLAYEKDGMEVWEMEGNPFYEKYKGFYRKFKPSGTELEKMKKIGTFIKE